MRFVLLRQVCLAIIGLLVALQTQTASAAGDTALLSSCREVLAATEPGRRVWLEKDLFAYEMRAAIGASHAEMRLYRENLIDTCGRVAHNNQLRKARGNMQFASTRLPKQKSVDQHRM